MSYYNYHAQCKKLIQNNHIIGATIFDSYKHISPALVLYFDNPQEKYKEIQDIINASTQVKLIELTANGPIKKVSIISNQIAGVALQEEQHLA